MNSLHIEIDLRLQQLYLFEPAPEGDILLRQYPVSTALNGAGKQNGSYCTPRRRHRIAEKIGAGAPLFAALNRACHTGKSGRRNRTPKNGAELDPDAHSVAGRPGAGKEPGRHGDSHDRYIYIHGTHEEDKIARRRRTAASA